MKYAEYDLSHMPVILCKVFPIDPTVQQYQQQMLDMQDKLLSEEERMIWILNLKNLKLLSSEVRILAGTWTKNNADKVKAKVIAAIIIEGSIWTTMVIKGMNLVAAAPIAVHTCRNIAEARVLMSQKYSIVVSDTIEDSPCCR